MSGYWPNILLLAAVWGASYLFIKVAVDEIEPAPMMAVRTLLAAAVLGIYLGLRIGWSNAAADLRAAWRHCLVLGVLNAALPFWLIAWGEKHIDSGLAAVVQASVPIFNALLVLRFLPHERLSATRAAGLGVGILGVVVVTGVNPGGSWIAVAGTLAIVVSSISYAGAGVYGQKAVSGTAGPVLATGSMLAGGLILLPVALFQLPAEVPSVEAIASVLALSLLGTALAQLVLFRTLALYGSARLALVTYLMPAFAIVYGALILDEAITATMLIGGALILAGVALASGTLRRPRRRSRPRSDMSVTIRRATSADLDFVAELYADDDVRPWLAAAGRYDRENVLADLERFEAEPGSGGVMLIEVDGEPAGVSAWERANERSRIARLGGLAIHPRLPRPPDLRRGRASPPAPADPRARLPPARARDLRLQRASPAPRRASRLRPRGRQAKGVPPRRRLGRRRLLRADRRRPDRRAAKVGSWS